MQKTHTAHVMKYTHISVFRVNLVLIAVYLLPRVPETCASTDVASCFSDIHPHPPEGDHAKSLLGWHGKCISKAYPCSESLFKNVTVIEKLSKREIHDNAEAYLNNSLAAGNILNYFAPQNIRKISVKDFSCLYLNRTNLQHEVGEHPNVGNTSTPSVVSCVAYFWELPKNSNWPGLMWLDKCSKQIRVKCSASLLLNYLSLTRINKDEISNKSELIVNMLSDIKILFSVSSSSNNTEYCINFNLQIMEEHMQKNKQEYEMVLQRMLWTHYLISPPLLIMLILGIVGNVAVLVITVAYPSMSNLHNIILRHVVIADLVTLGHYCLILYSSFNGPVAYTKAGCYFIVTASTVATAVSQYAMVILSIIRYLAVKAVPGSREDQLLCRFNKNPILQAVLWTLAITASTPYISSVYYNYNLTLCGARNSLEVQYADFACFCVLPLLAICVFSLKTNIVLRRSVLMVPQSSRRDCTRKNRLKSARILVALVIVFCVSYFPFSVIRLFYNRDMASLYYVAMVLRPLNAVLNPWAVCLASRAFKRHLLCQRPEPQESTSRCFPGSSRVTIMPTVAFNNTPCTNSDLSLRR